MKKIISVMLILTMVCSAFFLSGCKDDEITLEEKVDTKLTAYKTDLEDSVETLDTPEKVTDYLSHWASAKAIDYSIDSYNNVIMEIETSEAYASAPPTVVICPYDTLQMNNSIAPMSVGMYLAKNNESTGHLTVIFTDNSGNRCAGLKNLSAEYIPDNANVFNISSNSKSYWAIHTGASLSYKFTGNVEYVEPENNKAFKITIDGLPGGNPDPSIGSYPNPIKRLGNLLAQLKTNALIYELADFNGGVSEALYPQSATMTIVIDEDDFEKFQKRIDKDIDKFNDKKKDEMEDATYTYEEVPVPQKVFSAKTKDNFVSFIYTLLDGSYYSASETDDEDELVAFTNMGYVNVNDDQFTVSAISNSLLPAALNEINNNFQLTCGLSEVQFNCSEVLPGWSAPSDTEVMYQIESAYSDYSDKKFKLREYIPFTGTQFIKDIKPNTNIINLSVSGKGLDNYAGTIINFMINQEHEESRLLNVTE